ncbi:hypothetical protein [Pedobacter paludis]|uniref:Uncharacterized protein n=1 Tax=Pedobacter paludis TaxID=2203212 RepID=A0A317EX76_9SPHI|nr:hypothetical protein [Pedobacter paludis]PWS29848.1 hypothetical protein DF947_21150 [Pedobacter paludis]
MSICLENEDNVPIEDIIKAVNKKLKEVHQLISELNLGKTEVKVDGVYRTFNDGEIVKIVSGSFKKVQVQSKIIKLF